VPHGGGAVQGIPDAAGGAVPPQLGFTRLRLNMTEVKHHQEREARSRSQVLRAHAPVRPRAPELV
jgi:hypothetical protein